MNRWLEHNGAIYNLDAYLYVKKISRVSIRLYEIEDYTEFTLDSEEERDNMYAQIRKMLLK